jgi:hypothetical protein
MKFDEIVEINFTFIHIATLKKTQTWILFIILKDTINKTPLLQLHTFHVNRFLQEWAIVSVFTFTLNFLD